MPMEECAITALGSDSVDDPPAEFLEQAVVKERLGHPSPLPSPRAAIAPAKEPQIPELIRLELAEWPRLRQVAARRKFKSEQRQRRWHRRALRWFRGYLCSWLAP